MSIDLPQDELSRTQSIEPNTLYPEILEVRLIWKVSGKQVIKSIKISADEFFGRGSVGAPLSGDNLLQRIEVLRRNGP